MMKPLEWSPRLTLGLEQIDEQHKWLIRLVNRLQQAVEDKASPDELLRVFEEMLDYARTHFRDEEQYMRDMGYPDGDDHAAQHRALTDEIAHLHRNLAAGEYVTATAAYELMKHWLVKHIIGHDLDIARYIKEKKIKESL